jgi:hypothetical protein
MDPSSRGVERPSDAAACRPRHEGAGKAGRRPRPWPACRKERRRQSPQVWPRQPGPPCAIVDRLIRALPGDRLSCPRRPQCSSKHRELGASTGAPGPHDFAVRADRARPAQPSRPSQPASTFVTTRTSLVDEAGCTSIITISEKTKQEYFSREGWTGRVALKSLANFVFRRRLLSRSSHARRAITAPHSR